MHSVRNLTRTIWVLNIIVAEVIKLGMFKLIKKECIAAMERDPAATSFWQVFWFYPGVRAIAAHRKAHELYKKGKMFKAMRIANRARRKTGIEIHPAAVIGEKVFIDHGTGVVIGETAVVGDGCTIYQGVTLGGTGKDVGKRHPTIGNNVLIGAGAKVLGPFTVGDNSKIAANAVVLKEIPPNSTCVGVPARIVKMDGVPVHFDHVNTPDPISQEICRLCQEIEKIKAEIAK